jgi:uncharacterized membrane protein YjdF
MIMIPIFVLLSLGLATGFVDVRAHDDEWFLTIMALVTAGSIFLPDALHRLFPSFGHWTAQTLDEIRWIWITMLIMGWIGSLGAYQLGRGYDSAVHFFSTLLGVWMVRKCAKTDQQFRNLTVLVLAAGVVNELFEFFGDFWWGTQMYGEKGQVDDTARDLVANTVGFVSGIVTVRYASLR